MMNNQDYCQEFESNYQRTFVNMYHTSSWMQQREVEFLKQFDLTPQQHNILKILEKEHPKQVSIKNIKCQMIDKMSDVSRLVERMRKKELVTRMPSDTDRRSVEVAITEKGLNILTQLCGSIDTHRNDSLQNLSAEEAEVLNQLLEKIRS